MTLRAFSKNNTNCIKCGLYAFCDVAELNAPLITHQQHLKRKETLYSCKDNLTHIYAIHSGAVKTYHIDLDGQERIVQFYLAGELIGFEAIHSNYHPFSAMTLMQTQVCQVSFNKFMSLIESNPILQKALLSSLSQRTNFGHYVTAATSEQRIASFLLELAKRLDANQPSASLELAMSRQDMGNYLGLAAETISRVLTRFQQMGLIVCHNKTIQLKNRSQLQYIAQE